MRLSPLDATWNRVASPIRGMGRTMDKPDQIGARLRLLRLALGYEQARPFCQRLEISDQAWNNYESGRRRISLDEVMKVVQKTGVSLDWVYRGLESTLPKHVADKIQDFARVHPEEVNRRASNG